MKWVIRSMVVHGTTVAMAGRAMLIRGESGSGKSSLALSLMALGAGLVADDRTCLTRDDACIMADAPATLRGLIEARHVGLLAAEAVGPVPLGWIVTLADALPPRLPDHVTEEVLGIAVPVLTVRADPALAPALRQLLLGGRAA